jgi:DNA-binding CsgD family transcriptional regulator/tetratricopeptide (TPR) repeat protein
MPPVSPAGTIVGRENELSRLTDLLRDLARGTGNAALIEGEPGIGKSTLVRALVNAATAPQALDAVPHVFWGTGDELGQELPLLPFLDALQVRTPGANARRNAIVAMLRGEAASDRGTDVTAAIAEQLLALVTDECAARPVILVIDDLQWSDPASVTLWARLARLAPQVALLLIGISRPVSQRDDLLMLRRAQNDSVRVELSALTEEAVAELVAALAGGRPGAPLLRLTNTAAGNPFYITEIVDALNRNGSLTVTEAGTAELANGITPTALPRSLSAAIADRLGFVPKPVHGALRVAALLGVQFAISDLATVLGKTVLDLIPAVDEAQTVGVLTESGSDLAFRHPLIHAALYDEMSVAVRTAMHRDAGQKLAAGGAPVDRVARQLLRAVGAPGSEGLASSRNGSEADAAGNGATRATSLDSVAAAPLDEWMLEWLNGAADLLVGQAPRVAVELLTQAVASTPIGASNYSWIASRLADALYRLGDRSVAEQVASQALEQASIPDPDVLVDLVCTLAQCRMLAGLQAQSLATLEEALASPGISARHRARLLVLSARTRSIMGEVDASGRVAADALASAEEAQDTWAMGWALHVLEFNTLLRGQLNEALPLYDRALGVTQANQALADLRLLLQINKAGALGMLGQLSEAVAVASQARRLAGQVGTTFRLSQAHCMLSQLFFATGRWDESLAEIAAVPQELKEPAGACIEAGTAALIYFHRGEPDTARRHLAESGPFEKRIGHRLVPDLALARSLDQEQAGEKLGALAALAEWFDKGTEELGQAEDLVADAVRLAVSSGELASAERLVKHATEFAEESEIPYRQANALYCSGLLDHDAPKLLTAADRYKDASRPLLMAKALEAAAEEFLAIDDRTASRDAFGRAVDAYTTLGAAADVNRVQAAFREHGMRLGSHAKHRRAQSGWDSLTDAELKIAAFVAEGLSNPEIAQRLVTSPRTVGTHVSHILKKLNFTSRAEIAREYALRGR